LQQLQAMDFAQLQNTLIALDVPLKSIPDVSLSLEQAEKIKQGQRIAFSGGMIGQVRIYSSQTFLGLGEILLDGKLAPKKLFHLDGQTA
jgi:tRNA pseudouridine55 synthase